MVKCWLFALMHGPTRRGTVQSSAVNVLTSPYRDIECEDKVLRFPFGGCSLSPSLLHANGHLSGRLYLCLSLSEQQSNLIAPGCAGGVTFPSSPLLTYNSPPLLLTRPLLVYIYSPPPPLLVRTTAFLTRSRRAHADTLCLLPFSSCRPVIVSPAQQPVLPGMPSPSPSLSIKRQFSASAAPLPCPVGKMALVHRAPEINMPRFSIFSSSTNSLHRPLNNTSSLTFSLCVFL